MSGYLIIAAATLSFASLWTHLYRWNANDAGARPGVPFAVVVLLCVAFLKLPA